MPPKTVNLVKKDVHDLKKGDEILVGIQPGLKPTFATIKEVKQEIVPPQYGKTYEIGAHAIYTVVAEDNSGQTYTQQQKVFLKEE